MALTTIGYFALAATAASAGSSIVKGNQAKDAANANAVISGQQGQAALESGTYEQGQIVRRTAAVTGAQQAAIGARNVATSGTALDLLSDTALLGGEDVSVSRSNTARQAWGYRVGAQLDRQAGQDAQSAGYVSAASTILTAGYKGYTSGMFSTGSGSPAPGFSGNYNTPYGRIQW